MAIQTLNGDSPIPVKTDAKFSACRRYRYALWRTWHDATPHAIIIGLNPSTADETEDDPTIRRCIGYARDWGFGGLCMVNLFAFRATEPKIMMASIDPVGTDNDSWIKQLASDAGVIVAAWGNDGSFMQRSRVVRDMIPGLQCLKINKTGEPAHPLYQPASATPVSMGKAGG